MLWAVFAPSPNMRLDNVPAIQEWHLSVRFDPYLVPCVRGNDVQSRDVNPEFPSFGEFSDTGAKRE